MQKLKDENYYVVHAWMINRLGLRGNELIVFAIMYGFCQDGEHKFRGSLSYIQQWMGVRTKHTVVKAIDGLVEKGIIVKETSFNDEGGHATNVYRVNYMTIDEAKNNQEYPCSKTEQGSAENALGSADIEQGGVVQKLHKGSAKIAQVCSAENAPPLVQKMHNNKDIYKDIYKDSNKDIYIAAPEKQKPTCKKIVESYNAICKSLPKVTMLSEKRKKAIKNLLGEFNGEYDMFIRLFSMAEESDFLTGRDGKWSTGASFDWLMNKNNAIKVLEGNYANKAKHPRPGAKQTTNNLEETLQTMYKEFGIVEEDDYDTITTETVD